MLRPSSGLLPKAASDGGCQADGYGHGGPAVAQAPLAGGPQPRCGATLQESWNCPGGASRPFAGDGNLSEPENEELPATGKLMPTISQPNAKPCSAMSLAVAVGRRHGPASQGSIRA